MSNLWPLSPPLLGPLTFYIPIPPLAYPRCFKHMVFFFIYWGRVDFQCHANLCCTAKWLSYTHISSVSHSCLTLCDPMDAACQACLSITNFQSLLKLMSIELMMPSNHLILCHPLLLLPSIFPSIRVFSNESVLCIRWPAYWSFSFSTSPSSEYSGLISFRMDWLDLLAVQGTLKSLL